MGVLIMTVNSYAADKLAIHYNRMDSNYKDWFHIISPVFEKLAVAYNRDKLTGRQLGLSRSHIMPSRPRSLINHTAFLDKLHHLVGRE